MDWWEEGRGRLPRQPPMCPDGQPSAVPSSSGVAGPGAGASHLGAGGARWSQVSPAKPGNVPLREASECPPARHGQACCARLLWPSLSPHGVGTSVLEDSKVSESSRFIQSLIHSFPEYQMPTKRWLWRYNGKQSKYLLSTYPSSSLLSRASGVSRVEWGVSVSSQTSRSHLGSLEHVGSGPCMFITQWCLPLAPRSRHFPRNRGYSCEQNKYISDIYSVSVIKLMTTVSELLSTYRMPGTGETAVTS